MKTIIKIMLMSVALVFFASLLAQAQNATNPRLISVTGDAEVKVVPDQAIITLGIETLDKSLSDAKESNDKLIKNLIKVATDAGVTSDNIQTDYLTITPTYDNANGERVFLGHNVSRRLVINLADISKFDDLLSSLVSAGPIQIQSTQFLTTELRKYRDQARLLAIKAASEKANALAQELGAKVGKPYEIEEKSSNWNSWRNYRSYGNFPNPFNASTNADNGPVPDANATTVIGKISVTASVSVKFELE